MGIHVELGPEPEICHLVKIDVKVQDDTFQIFTANNSQVLLHYC